MKAARYSEPLKLNSNNNLLEAAIGIEPMNKGFADLASLPLNCAIE